MSQTPLVSCSKKITWHPTRQNTLRYWLQTIALCVLLLTFLIDISGTIKMIQFLFFFQFLLKFLKRLLFHHSKISCFGTFSWNLITHFKRIKAPTCSAPLILFQTTLQCEYVSILVRTCAY